MSSKTVTGPNARSTPSTRIQFQRDMNQASNLLTQIRLLDFSPFQIIEQIWQYRHVENN